MRITVLAGGVGGARYVRGVREEVRRRWPDGNGGSAASLRPAQDTAVDVVVNTGDDLWLAGVRLMPDFDSLLYALAGVNDADRGWGRAGETERVAAELREWGVGWPWFTLGDLDLGTHLARTAWLREGRTVSEVAERLQRRWPLGVHLLPATDTEVDTHVLVADPEEVDGERELHFQEWWTRYRASLPALAFRQRNLDVARPARGVVEAILGADVVLLAPSNPVVSIGTIVSIPGIREAIAATHAPVVGVSPIIGGKVVRGMADACLPAIGVATTAEAVGRHYGARSAGGLLDGWLVDESDAAAVDALAGTGLVAASVPLWMRDLDTSAALAGAALDLAERLRGS
ncbi:2-phospho-L-lactate transferase [Agromyces mariniharenae]|uniref:2-phospho-L-lactate transferase n=1 Tax=Agromyces mariniharenae TaxID=2604423 RepID=A0A5S4V8X7_9MICO|nr:2-phospho-L-lactate transferase [Agromyces mariniharenae]TYL53781.1 2-phospho-L-lactate transferase [Agromyces mariniharenae]